MPFVNGNNCTGNNTSGGTDHTHDNKSVLDRLSDKIGELYYKGKPVNVFKSFPVFSMNTEYDFGQVILHDKKLYSAKKAFISSGVFVEEDWESIGGDSIDKEIFDRNNNDIVDYAESLVGMMINISELNSLIGVSSNVQAQIDSLRQGMIFKGIVSTKSELIQSYPNPKMGDTLVVERDETKENIRTLYTYSGEEWIYLGAFEFAVRDFNTNPIELGSEVTGVLPEKNIDSKIARKSDLHTHSNHTLLETYTNKNEEISDAILLRHEHKNKSIIDYFGENSKGRLTWKDNSIGGSDGRDLEFLWDGTRLGIRVEGQEEYSYTDLKGIAGSEIELRNDGESIEWKYQNETVWNHLVSVSELALVSWDNF